MNVLQLICPTGFYGAERWILALARHAKESGFNCSLCVTVEPPYAEPEVAARYPEDAGDVYVLRMRNRFDLSILKSIENVVRTNSIDIIHTHGYKSDTIGCLVARKTNIPIVATAHGYTKVTSAKDRLYHVVGNSYLRKMDKVVPLSKQLCKEVLNRGVSEEKVLIIGNGVDVVEIDSIRHQKIAGRVSKSKRIGYVGQLVKRKRVDLLLQVFDRLWHDDHNLSLDILGDGDQREELSQLADNLPSHNSITFHGFVQKRLQVVLDLDLMLFTSSEEGIPRTLMEAMALEIPCAAFNIPGVDELITHQINGLLAKYGDVDDLYRCCSRLLNEQSFADQIGKAARESVLDKFSAQRMTESYERLFKDILAGR